MIRCTRCGKEMHRTKLFSTWFYVCEDCEIWEEELTVIQYDVYKKGDK